MLLLEQIINILAPHSCVGCGQEGTPLCPTCGDSIPSAPRTCYLCEQPVNDAWNACMACTPTSSLRCLYVAAPYDGLAQKVIHHLKFERANALASRIADRVACLIPAAEFDVVTYVPTASSRIRARGYDQARCIAQSVAKRLGLPCIALISRNGQVRQVGQGRQNRLSQARMSFVVRRPSLVAQNRILLIDDVLTTGATFTTIGNELRKAGASEVSGAVFARAIRGLDKA